MISVIAFVVCEVLIFICLSTGSLANGSAEQVQTLVEQYDLVAVMIKEICSNKNSEKCIELCLSILKSLFELPQTPLDDFFSDECSLSYFLGKFLMKKYNLF